VDGRGLQEALERELSRRTFLHRGGTLGLTALIASAAPFADRLTAQAAAAPQPTLPDATLQAFADTMIPGRKAIRTDLGNSIHPRAIAGVDARPGAVEADALALYNHPLIGFAVLAPVFLADLTLRSLLNGGDFLSLPHHRRVRVCVSGLGHSNPDRLVWEAAAAVPFTAFCAAAVIPEQTAAKASGYRVMGLPGRAPSGYTDFSYGTQLATERTATGSLP
jgi:hypothetical protein